MQEESDKREAQSKSRAGASRSPSLSLPPGPPLGVGVRESRSRFAEIHKAAQLHLSLTCTDNLQDLEQMYEEQYDKDQEGFYN